MKEKDIYAKMKTKCKKNKISLQRFEAYSIPDIFYCTSMSRMGWIELKVIKRFPKKSDYVTVPFRPGQYAWIKNFLNYSDQVFLFLYIENSLFIFQGTDIRQTYSISNISLLSCYNSLWSAVDWYKIINLL